MRKTMLKQEFSEFSVSKEEGLHKGYDWFQKILSQLNQTQAKRDNDDVNMKFLRALPPSCGFVGVLNGDIEATITSIPIPTTPTQVPPITPDLATVFVHADTELHADVSRPDASQTASEQVSAEHTVDVATTVAFTSGVSHATPSSSCRRRKQIAKKRVTPKVYVNEEE
nr:ribonuclease H-like domain, reverse transcriptase, RNA-dependent DNA polymerase [Tanacetum cinerariifolium]